MVLPWQPGMPRGQVVVLSGWDCHPAIMPQRLVNYKSLACSLCLFPASSYTLSNPYFLNLCSVTWLFNLSSVPTPDFSGVLLVSLACLDSS